MGQRSVYGPGDDRVGPGLFFREESECPVVEDIAVLIDLNKSRSRVFLSPLDHFLQVLRVPIHSARHKRRTGTQCERNRYKRIVDYTLGCGFRYLAEYRGGGVLSFGQTVNLIVKQNDFDADIPSEQVDHVISTDTQAVSVAGCNPHLQVGIGEFHSCCDRCSASMDSMDPERVDVIRKAA